METHCYVWEEGGYFYLTDKYDLRHVRFHFREERQKWIDGFKEATGKDLIVHEGKPDVIEALSEGLQVSEEVKDQVAEKYSIRRK